MTACLLQEAVLTKKHSQLQAFRAESIANFATLIAKMVAQFDNERTKNDPPPVEKFLI